MAALLTLILHTSSSLSISSLEEISYHKRLHYSICNHCYAHVPIVRLQPGSTMSKSTVILYARRLEADDAIRNGLLSSYAEDFGFPL